MRIRDRLTVCCLAVWLVGAAHARESTVPNRGFERWSGNAPVGWKSDAVDRSAAARTGTAALRLTAKPYKRWFLAKSGPMAGTEPCRSRWG